MEDIEFEIQRVRISTLLIYQVIKGTHTNFKKNVTMTLSLEPPSPFASW